MPLAGITVREPKPFEWFRVRAEPPPSIVIRTLFARRNFWIVDEEAAGELNLLEAPSSSLSIAINHQGDAFIWPVSQIPNVTARSLVQARDTGLYAWTRIAWRPETRTFDVLTAANFGRPVFSSAIAARLQGGEPSLKHVVEIGQPFFNEPV